MFKHKAVFKIESSKKNQLYYIKLMKFTYQTELINQQKN